MQGKRYVFSKAESRNPTSILSVPLGIVSGNQVDASTATNTFLLLNLSSETKLSFTIYRATISGADHHLV